MSDSRMRLHDMRVADLVVPCVEIFAENDPDKTESERYQRDQTAERPDGGR
jgi:hypothetical protein